MESPNYLTVVAHPDDAEGLFGHTLQRDPSNVTVIVATNGDASTIDKIGGCFVAHGRRLEESERGLTRLGVRAEAGQQVHLGYSEEGFEFRADELADRVLKTIVDQNIGLVIGFDKDGFDQNSGHVTTHIAVEAAVREARITFDRSVGFLALSSMHDGLHQTDAPLDSTHIKLAAMAEHASQFAIHAIREDNPAPRHAMPLAGHSIELETWERLQQVLPLIVGGETYHEL